MSAFLIRRTIHSLIVLFVMSIVIYALIGLMPGDPVDLMISADPDITSADAARLRAIYGLDQPLWSRYANWLGAALTGDFGYRACMRNRSGRRSLRPLQTPLFY